MLEELRHALSLQGLAEVGPEAYTIPSPRIKTEFRSILEFLAPQTILEMGSWEGRSAIGWLQIAASLGLRPEMVCVDTWLGSPEHWLDDFPDGEWSRQHLRVTNDSPTVYDTFCASIRASGFADQVVGLRMTNRVATDILQRLGLQFDLIYVDGAHDIRSVISDLLDASTLVAPGGLILGDDWGWKSVRQAAHFTAALKRMRLFASTERTSFALTARREHAALDPTDWRRVRLMPSALSTIIKSPE